MSVNQALVKRNDVEMALMPPPPTKQTKRPSTVLDEDDYTDALSEIIARDFFPGLAEAKAQEEYLAALDSKNDVWIREAGQKLKETVVPPSEKKARRTTRDTRFDTPRPLHSRTPVSDTPRGPSTAGSETPMSVAETEPAEEPESKRLTDTSGLSLSSFQAKYTSEDNESFNALLDKQNNNRRKKHAYLWTSDQRIPGQRLLAHRVTQSQLLEAKATHEALATKHNEQALVPISTGATASRPASVDSWHQKTPANTLMFHPAGIEESDPTLTTIQETKESLSKAGPRETVFANTRFPPRPLLDNDEHDPSSSSIPPSPSLNTTIIARRDARRAANISSTTVSDIPSSTPRVAGYAFVDEDEDQPSPPSSTPRPDLLANHPGDATPNPFRLSDLRRREDLHLRLVARDQARKRKTLADRTPVASQQGGGSGGGGSMTPAARRLMERLGRTPARATADNEAVDERALWTPGRTPRRVK